MWVAVASSLSATCRIVVFSLVASCSDSGVGVHVEAHPSECLSLLMKRLVYFIVGLLDQCSERALEELRLSVGLPGGRHWTCATTHRLLKVFVLDLLRKIRREMHFDLPIDKVHVCESELESDIAFKLDDVLYRKENCAKSIFDNVFAEVASSSDRYSVCKDHTETLLVHRPLRLWLINRVFAVVSHT